MTTTMPDRAALFMSAGKGLLVLDNYALAPMAAPAWPGISFERYTELVMRSTELARYLSGVFVASDTVLAAGARGLSPPWRADRFRYRADHRE